MVNNNEEIVSTPNQQQQDSSSELGDIKDVLTEILEALNITRTEQLPSPTMSDEQLKELNASVNEALEQAENSLQTGKAIGTLGASIGLLNIIMYAYNKLTGRSSGAGNMGGEAPTNSGTGSARSSENPSSSGGRKEDIDGEQSKNNDNTKTTRSNSNNKGNSNNKSSDNEEKEERSNEKSAKKNNESNTKEQSSELSTRESFIPVVGEHFGTITFQGHHLSMQLLEGTEPYHLQHGLGHYISSAFPTDHEQIIFAGYYEGTTYRIRELMIGNTFTIEMPYGSYHYRINKIEMIHNSQLQITRLIGKEELVITMSDAHTTSQRYIIYAESMAKDKSIV
ncbi:hypothetical protein NV377_20425 [Paenibacillus sp. T3-5-0-4]|nr:hypothetical protein [Paenibacillus endoradicis]